jgi:membrane protein DedA with SNARE-associated domain
MEIIDTIGAWFDALIAWAESLGLWAVFILTLIDSLGLPATGDAAMLIWSGLREYPLLAVIAVGFAGGLVGDSIAYWAGRLIGRPIVRRALPGDYEQKIATRLDRHAAPVLVFSRLVAALRTKIAVLAGAMHMPYHRFLLWNALGCALWAVTFALVGRLVGDALGVTDQIHRVGIVVIVAVVIVIALALVQRHFLPRLRRRPPSVPR